MKMIKMNKIISDCFIKALDLMNTIQKFDSFCTRTPQHQRPSARFCAISNLILEKWQKTTPTLLRKISSNSLPYCHLKHFIKILLHSINTSFIFLISISKLTTIFLFDKEIFNMILYSMIIVIENQYLM